MDGPHSSTQPNGCWLKAAPRVVVRGLASSGLGRCGGEWQGCNGKAWVDAQTECPFPAVGQHGAAWREGVHEGTHGEPWAEVDAMAQHLAAEPVVGSGPWQEPKAKTKPVGACISASHMAAIPSQDSAAGPPKLTMREHKAQDTKSIRSRYMGEGRCLCAAHRKHGKPACHRAVSLPELLALCKVFTHMPPTARAFTMNHLYKVGSGQQDDSQVTMQRISWYIGSAKVCFKNFCHLLQIGSVTVREMIACPGKQSSQIPKVKRRARHQSSAVDFWFQEWWQSCAEGLPAPSKRAKSDSGVDHDITFDDGGSGEPNAWCLDAGGPLHGKEDVSWNPDRPTVDTTNLLTVAADGKDVGLPVRFLNHSSLFALYWVFCASWSALGCCGVWQAAGDVPECPSFATFRRRWHEVWRFYLKFRKTSCHAMCTTCFKLQQMIEDPKSDPGIRWKAALELKQHYRDTYLDRQIYWNLRAASRAGSNVLTIIIDSMDKAKFAWPRWPFAVRPHDLASIIRPRLTFTIAWAHGFCCDMYAAAEHVNHGSDAFLEVLCQTIQNVQKICQSQGRRFPEHLVIQSDNTVAQAKNQWVGIFLAWLVQSGYFISANLFFMVVGHTHEDIGAHG